MEGQRERGGVDPGGEITPRVCEGEGGPGGGEASERPTQGFVMTQLGEEETEELRQSVVGAVAAHTEARASETGEEGSSEGGETLTETGVCERRPAGGRGVG